MSPHSLFGVTWQIIDATGWSIDYIMWRINYQTLRMMLADAPRYVTTHDKKEDGDTKGSDKPRSVAGFFQTKFNNPDD